jgi:hypothetical protein
VAEDGLGSVWRCYTTRWRTRRRIRTIWHAPEKEALRGCQVERLQQNGGSVRCHNYDWPLCGRLAVRIGVVSCIH